MDTAREMPDSGSWEISVLAERATEFRRRLDDTKLRIGATQFPWYPYDLLGNLHTLDRLLTGSSRCLLRLASGKPILDIGCADGDSAFFIASLGYRACAIDNPITNYNSMCAVRTLNEALGGVIDITAADLDGQFDLPERSYGLTFLMGVLYHLKNPYRVLDVLSRHAEYAVISTSVTSYVPGLYDNIGEISVAYLADVYEINRDSTNYWLFSDAGFRRLLRRSNGEICDYRLIGTALTGGVGEQRAFTLVRSRFSGSRTPLLLGEGWHEPEEEGWRWTTQYFAVRFEGAVFAESFDLILTIFVPDILTRTFGRITLSACANGFDLQPDCFSVPGTQVYRRTLAGVPLFGGEIRIDFSLDRALPPDPTDPRERGIVVQDLRLVPSTGGGYGGR